MFCPFQPLTDTQTRCFQIKKGCDLANPTCGRCNRLGFACTYEDRQYTFINEGAGLSSRAVDQPIALSTGSQRALARRTGNDIITVDVRLSEGNGTDSEVD